MRKWLARIMPAADGMRGEEAAGRGNSSTAYAASHTQPDAAGECGSHRALRRQGTGKRQHRNLQLCARKDGDRFKNRAYQAGLQKDERRN
jgi:hypothetical protein